jgi:hypothetical protein
MDSKWLNAWSIFVNSKTTATLTSNTDLEDELEPGPVSSKDLLKEDGTPLDGLKPKIDYRGFLNFFFKFIL